MVGTLAQTIGKIEGWKYTPLHGVVLPEPSQSSAPLFDNRGDQFVWDRIAAPRVIVVEKNTQKTVIDDAVSGLDGTMITIEENASLVHIRFYEETETPCFAPVHARVAGGGSYTHIALSRGSKLLRLPVQVGLLADNAQCDIRGVHRVSDERHVDQVVSIKHLAPHCLSNQAFRYIVSDDAQATFQGKIHVARDAQKTLAYQLCKSLLLSEGAQVNTKPELEIYADDVKCSHGATIGALDERALFYMQSRGVPRAEAQNMLMQGFITETFEGLDLPDDIVARIEGFLA